MQQFREVSRTKTIYSTETHTSDFILNTFWKGKPVQFFQERCWVVVTGCQENKSCSKVLNFLDRLDDKIRCTHEETVAVVKPWKDIGSNKSLGCVFSEKPADWTNAFKLEISSLADFYDVLLRGQFWVKNESKVPSRIIEGDVVRAKSNRVREGNGRRFQERRKGKEKSFSFVVIQFELIFRHPCFHQCRLCMHWVLWWVWSLYWGERISGAVCHLRKAFEWLAMISESGVVYRTKRMGPSTEPWGTPYTSCDGDEDELLTERDWYLSERYDWNHWSTADWMPKTEFRRERRIWWSVVSKAAERSNKRRTEMLSLSRAERISFTIRNKTVSVLCPTR